LFSSLAASPLVLLRLGAGRVRFVGYGVWCVRGAERLVPPPGRPQAWSYGEAEHDAPEPEPSPEPEPEQAAAERGWGEGCAARVD
jgi:hypothetical protein